MKLPICPSFLLCAAVLVIGGCASFNHEWKEASRNPTPLNDLQGRWQGVWVSDVTRHTDKLRCVIEQKADGAYRARFHAKYRKVLSFGYVVPLNVKPTSNGYAFHGQANLGWMAGGRYQYDGVADATNFQASYSCKYDRGTFQMKRP